MEPATIVRLIQIEGVLRSIEEEKGRQQQRLAAFWEHLPPIDPGLVAQAMQNILDRIRSLDDQRRALLLYRQELIVGAAAAANPPPNPPGNEH